MRCPICGLQLSQYDAIIKKIHASFDHELFTPPSDPKAKQAGVCACAGCGKEIGTPKCRVQFCLTCHSPFCTDCKDYISKELHSCPVCLLNQSVA